MTHDPRRVIGLVILTVCCGALWSACATTANREKLLDSIYDYNDGLRWGRNDIVAWLPPEERQAMLGQMAAHQDVQMSDVVVEGMQMAGESQAFVTVRVAWYRLGQGTVHSATLLQHWQRLSKEGWHLKAIQTVSGAPFPYLPPP